LFNRKGHDALAIFLAGYPDVTLFIRPSVGCYAMHWIFIANFPQGQLSEVFIDLY
jgi:hypothetical protein